MDPAFALIGARPPRRVAAWIGVAGICLVVALGVVILVLGNGPLPIDQYWHDLMLSARRDVPLSLARGMDVIGGVTSMIVIGIALVAGFLIARRPWSALAVVSAMLVSEAIGGVLKVAIARERPLDSLSTIGFTSYPSGHTSLAAAVAVVLALLIGRRLVWVLALVWIVAMAWSRTYLEAHWLSDTFGGAVLGVSVALLAWSLVGSLELRTVRRLSTS